MELRDEVMTEINKLSAAYATNLAEIQQENERLKAEHEQLQVQLAGCAVAALGGTKDPAVKFQYGWSPAYQDVLDLRIDYERLKVQGTGLYWDEKFQGAEIIVQSLRTERDRLAGQLAEAQKVNNILTAHIADHLEPQLAASERKVGEFEDGLKEILLLPASPFPESKTAQADSRWYSNHYSHARKMVRRFLAGRTEG